LTRSCEVETSTFKEFFQEYVYGLIPPDTVIIIEPVAPPKQRTLLTASILIPKPVTPPE
jgi:hypothetical protein